MINISRLERQKFRRDSNSLDKSEELEFLLTEYEGIYTFIQIHYTTSEKIMQTFLLILGFLVSAIAWLYDGNHAAFDLFKLQYPIPHISFVVAVIGYLFFMMATEHRIKVIYYARCLNSIRATMKNRFRWVTSPTLLPTSVKVPPYFVYGRDFFWELLAFAFMNAFATAVAAIAFLNNLNMQGDNMFGALAFVEIVACAVLMHFLSIQIRTRIQEKAHIDSFPRISCKQENIK
jgi:hypothetical protein